MHASQLSGTLSMRVGIQNQICHQWDQPNNPSPINAVRLQVFPQYSVPVLAVSTTCGLQREWTNTSRTSTKLPRQEASRFCLSFSSSLRHTMADSFPLKRQRVYPCLAVSNSSNSGQNLTLGAKHGSNSQFSGCFYTMNEYVCAPRVFRSARAKRFTRCSFGTVVANCEVWSIPVCATRKVTCHVYS